MTQESRNAALLAASHYMRPEVVSDALPFRVSMAGDTLSPEINAQWDALSKKAARIALSSLASLAKINELDHLGGGLELIQPLLLTLGMIDNEKSSFTIEHAHTSIGCYSVLAALGFLDETIVIDEFRRGLDIAGHVSWLPGGCELNGGRLGVMIPAAVGQALGLKAHHGDEAFMVCHCGDAGWISGQALNGFNVADLHHAPIIFIMHRNGIQLSGACHGIMPKDPRPIIRALGVEVLEIESLHDPAELHATMRRARELARGGKPSLIYPTGCRSTKDRRVDLRYFGDRHGILREVETFAAKHEVPMDTEIWLTGSLMSFRDVVPMIECLFLVNGLPGGEAHHDGHMKGRDLATVLANPMLLDTESDMAALASLRSAPPRRVVTKARPAPGSPNLVLSTTAIGFIELPAGGNTVSPRAGSEAAYAALAKEFPKQIFVASCDLDSSTKLAKTHKFLPKGHRFECSIEEQVAAIMMNGVSVSSMKPQLNIFSTFAAFFEGIAREGFDMWRYQRNLTGANEGLNVTYHLSHVGACTGRDHFSGWSLDWINMALCYLPYLHRFYAPADARVAFNAVLDLAAHYGAHVIGIPRDNLPVLTKADRATPLWNPGDAWEDVTPARVHADSRAAIVAVGAPSFLAIEAADQSAADGKPADVLIVNSLPLPGNFLSNLAKTYKTVVTIEDGLIGTPEQGLRGLAGVVAGALRENVRLSHIGISDPRIAPSDGHMEVWAHFGITKDAVVEALRGGRV